MATSTSGVRKKKGKRKKEKKVREQRRGRRAPRWVTALVDFEFIVIADVTGRAVGEMLLVGFLPGQVRFMEESREENEIAQVHREAEANIHASDVTVHFATLQVLIGGYVDGTADHHLSELQSGDHHGNRFRRSVSHCLERVVSVHN